MSRGDTTSPLMQRRNSCFVDLLPRLGVARVVISLTHPCVLSFTKHTLTFHHHPAHHGDDDGEAVEVQMPANLPGIDPSQATRCEYKRGEGIQTRFQLLSTLESTEPASPYEMCQSFASTESTVLLCVFCEEVLARSW